jgi:hypothetical protein
VGFWRGGALLGDRSANGSGQDARAPGVGCLGAWAWGALLGDRSANGGGPPKQDARDPGVARKIGG